MKKSKKFIIKTVFPAAAIVLASTGAFLTIRTRKRLKEDVPQAGYSHSYITKKGAESVVASEPEVFQGGYLKTICGALVYDMSHLKFPSDSTLTCDAYMGSLSVIVPENLNIILDGVCFAGNCVSLTPRYLEPDTFRLHVKARAYMGSICIRTADEETKNNH